MILVLMCSTLEITQGNMGFYTHIAVVTTTL